MDHEMGEICSIHGRSDKYIQSFAGKYEGKEKLARPTHRWVYNFKLRHKGCESKKWIPVTQDMDH